MRNKFEVLVHYICDKRSDRPDTLGKVKLNKAAWLSDRASYLLNLKAITEETYIKRQYGPVALNMGPTLDKLAKAGDLAIRGVDYFGYQKYVYYTLTKPDLRVFSPEEIDIINDVIDYVCDKHTASSISFESHDIIWQSAAIGEELPLYTVFAANPGELTETDVAWANEEAARLGL